MTTYYVGPSGSDAASGLTWALRFLTLGKAATSVTAGGDTVYVGPGTYREQLTHSVSGGNTYTTGTVTVTYGSTTVTGAGTDFTTGSAVLAGYYFKSQKAGAIKIAAVNSATELILDVAYDGPTEAGITYITFNPIHWIGDYSGANTDGVGGIVRITGSADDITITRTNCMTSSIGISYVRLVGFALDLATQLIDPSSSAGRGWIIDKCHLQNGGQSIRMQGANQLDFTTQNCYIGTGTGNNGQCQFTHSSTVSNAGHVIRNCAFETATAIGGMGAIGTTRVGGIIIKNSSFRGNNRAVSIEVSLAAGQTVTVNNCNLVGTNVALVALVLGEIIEDYNNFYGNTTNRTLVAVGANSIAYPPLFDTRWWFELVA